MSSIDLSREQRLQAKLYGIFPIYEFMQLSVVSLGNPLRCSVPLLPQTSNHFGVMHAGVLFSLAEAAAGLSITQHREFAKMLIIAQNVTVTYRRPARTGVEAIVSLDDRFLHSLREKLVEDPRHRFQIPVELSDQTGEIVTRATCDFQLRAAAI